MNISPAPHPRLACRIVRPWIAVFGDASAGGLRGLGSGHVAACDDCRRFFSACHALELALKREATQQASPMPAGIEQRITRAAGRSVPTPHPRATRLVPLALAGAVACAALAVLVVQHRSPLPDVPPPDQPAFAADQVWSSLEPSADALMAAEPLQHEVDAVVSDAKSAVRFLERNFLPSAPSEAQGRSG